MGKRISEPRTNPVRGALVVGPRDLSRVEPRGLRLAAGLVCLGDGWGAAPDRSSRRAGAVGPERQRVPRVGWAGFVGGLPAGPLVLGVPGPPGPTGGRGR